MQVFHFYFKELIVCHLPLHVRPQIIINFSQTIYLVVTLLVLSDGKFTEGE